MGIVHRPDSTERGSSAKTEWSWPLFIGLLSFQLWAAHALVFFSHEYAHSFTAWLLGWKANPFALNYAHPTMLVLLIQLGINQNVNEAPIYSSGHGYAAAVIAAAGMVVGNLLISLLLSRLGYALAVSRHRMNWAMFFYWTTVASLGNAIDYVPVRTFTTEGDMGSIQRGFGWSPWTVLIVLGLPTAILLINFLVRIQPDTLSRLLPNDRPKQALIVLVTSGLLFGFYGAAGMLEGGPISYQLSRASVYVAFPAVAIMSWILVQRRAGKAKKVRGSDHHNRKLRTTTADPSRRSG